MSNPSQPSSLTAAGGGDALSALAAAAAGLPSEARQHSLLSGPDWVTDRAPPPIHKWNPDHCGDIGMEIRSDGSWWHAGAPIRRAELVKLFASILRREASGDFFLVTPVEKVIVHVALHPLRVVDAEPLAGHSPETLVLTLNTGGTIPLDDRHDLSPEPKAANAVFVTLDSGLTALFTRAAWYRLVERADESGQLSSGGRLISLLPG